MQMNISAGSAASLTCKSHTKNTCQMCLEMLRYLTNIWRADSNPKWNQKDEAIYAQAVQPQITCWTGGPEAQQIINLLGCSL